VDQVERVSHRDILESFVQKSENLEKQCLSKAIKSYCELRVLPYELNKTVVFWRLFTVEYYILHQFNILFGIYNFFVHISIICPIVSYIEISILCYASGLKSLYNSGRKIAKTSFISIHSISYTNSSIRQNIYKLHRFLWHLQWRNRRNLNYLLLFHFLQSDCVSPLLPPQQKSFSILVFRFWFFCLSVRELWRLDGIWLRVDGAQRMDSLVLFLVVCLIHKTIPLLMFLCYLLLVCSSGITMA